MESNTAIRRLSALAQDGRLSAFRMLVHAGHEGIRAGDLARELDIAPNTLSSQLSVLLNAGLITSRRDGRSIIYAAELGAVSELIAYLVDDCCGGHPEICALVASVSAGAARTLEPAGD